MFQHKFNKLVEEALDERDRYAPRRTTVESLKGDVLDFCSNDTLGLATHPNLVEAASVAACRFGVGSSASRLVFERAPLNMELETRFAAWTGFERALYCGSGFTANCAIIEAIVSLGNKTTLECFVDLRAHASIHAGFRQARFTPTYFQHRLYDQLARKLIKSTATLKVIFVEALHSMEGDYEDAAALADLCALSGALLVLDEAHSIGIIGPYGSGFVASHPKLRNCVLAAMYGCGKALGVGGGVIAASKSFIDLVVNTSKAFVYSTGPSPMLASALLASLELLSSDEGRDRRTTLRANVEFLANATRHLPVVRFAGGSPIVLLDCKEENDCLAIRNTLRAKQISVAIMRPPTVPRGKLRIRIVVRASHSVEHIAQLGNALEDCRHLI